MNTKTLRRAVGATTLASLIFGVPLALTACDKDVSKSKTTTTRETSTPDGVKKTTETSERKVETEHKNP